VILWLAASASDRAKPKQVLRIGFKRRIDLGSVAKEVLSFGIAETGLDPWQNVVDRFVDRLPGSGWAAVIGTPRVDLENSVAVADVQLSPRIMSVATLGEVARTLELYLGGAEITDVTGSPSLDAGDEEAALAAAAAKKRANDPLEKLKGLLKGGAVVLIVVALGAVLLYAAVVRRRMTA
jgi:hypothetical protein